MASRALIICYTAGGLTPPVVTPTLFFFNDTATTEIYTLSLHDALPIYNPWHERSFVLLSHKASRPRITDFPIPPEDPAASRAVLSPARSRGIFGGNWKIRDPRSEEHTSELQSHSDLVCRLLLEKKKTQE